MCAKKDLCVCKLFTRLKTRSNNFTKIKTDSIFVSKDKTIKN